MAKSKPKLNHKDLSLANDFLQRTFMFRDNFFFKTRTSDEKDDNNGTSDVSASYTLFREKL